MHFSLTSELEACIKARVNSGLYNNASEGISIQSGAGLDKLFDDIKG